MGLKCRILDLIRQLKSCYLSADHSFNRMARLILILILGPIVSFGQLSKQDSVWLPLKLFIGSWTGESEGQPGKGRYERSYQFVLNKKFIEVRNKSTYAPSQDKPKGELHEDIGYISYDRSRKKFVLRQFHMEGFVNQYSLESVSPDGGTLVFISESIENIPVGFRARETYHWKSENEFTEVFELAEPGKSFDVYSKALLKKALK